MVNDMWQITEKDEDKLLLIRSDATLDFFKIQEALYQIYIKNGGRYSSYNRLIDLSMLKDINTHFDSIRDLIKAYRNTNPLENNVKIAVYIPFGITQAILQIYCKEENIDTNRFLVSGSFDECVRFLSEEKNERKPSTSRHFIHSGVPSFSQST